MDDANERPSLVPVVLPDERDDERTAWTSPPLSGPSSEASARRSLLTRCVRRSELVRPGAQKGEALEAFARDDAGAGVGHRFEGRLGRPILMQPTLVGKQLDLTARTHNEVIDGEKRRFVRALLHLVVPRQHSPVPRQTRVSVRGRNASRAPGRPAGKRV